MKNVLRLVAIGACLATMSLAGGCSGDDSRSAGSPPSEEFRSFSVDEADLSFDLSSDWEEFDRDKMEEALSDNSVMDDLSDRTGVSRKQFQQMLANNIVLWVTAPHAVSGFLSNVNVVVADAKLPSVGTLELQYRGLGAADLVTDEVSTDVGDGYVTTYTLELPGTVVHGQAINLDVDDQMVVITVSSHDADEADRVAREIRQSLAPTS